MNHKSNKINKLLLEQERFLNDSLNEKWWPFSKRKAAAEKSAETDEEWEEWDAEQAEIDAGEAPAADEASSASLESPIRNVPNEKLEPKERKLLLKKREQIVNATHAAGQTIVKTLISNGFHKKQIKGTDINAIVYVLQDLLPSGKQLVPVGVTPSEQELMSDAVLRKWAEDYLSTASDDIDAALKVSNMSAVANKIVRNMIEEIVKIAKNIEGAANTSDEKDAAEAKLSDDESGDFNAGLDMLRDEFKNPEATASDFNDIWREMDPDKISTDGVKQIISILSTLARADDNPGNKAEQETFINAVSDWASKRTDPDGPDVDPDGETEKKLEEEIFRRMNKLAGLII